MCQHSLRSSLHARRRRRRVASCAPQQKSPCSPCSPCSETLLPDDFDTKYVGDDPGAWLWIPIVTLPVIRQRCHGTSRSCKLEARRSRMASSSTWTLLNCSRLCLAMLASWGRGYWMLLMMCWEQHQSWGMAVGRAMVTSQSLAFQLVSLV